MQDFHRALKQLCARRQSIRDFSDRPVAPELIEKIKTIAHTSPYASGRKNWQILAVNDLAVIHELAEVTKRQAQDVATTLRAGFEEGYTAYAQHFSAFASAPLLLVPVFRIMPSLSYMQTRADPGIVQWERDNYVKSIACVAMLILLAAESLGLGACFMTGPLLAEASLAEILKIKPGSELGAIIPVGYPVTT